MEMDKINFIFNKYDSFSLNDLFTSLIESNLSNNVKGEHIAKQIYELGYINIYLATGYDMDKFVNLTFLTGVIGKKAPF